MNLGKMILELRKKKNATQEEMAAELGVTAAAVSKWENSYTLPDLLMLCALADYFCVTTDELLGRSAKPRYAVIAAASSELGDAIADLLKQHGFITQGIYSSYAEALTAAKADPTVSHLFHSLNMQIPDEEKSESDDIVCVESRADTTEQILYGFEYYFKNATAIDSLALKHPIHS